MKKISVFLLSAILFFGTLKSQDQSTVEPLKLRPFGMGLHVEQFRLMELYSSDSYVTMTNNILLVFNAGQHFRIEPEIGIMTYKSDDNDDPNTGLSFGTGLFGMFNKKDVNFYIGLRINYSRTKTKDYNDAELIYNMVKLGPTIGAEYYFSPHFSFGGEVALKYAEMNLNADEDSQSYEDENSSYFDTETGLFVRFFF